MKIINKLSKLFLLVLLPVVPAKAQQIQDFEAHGVALHDKGYSMFLSFDAGEKPVKDLLVFRYNNVNTIQLSDSLVCIREGQIVASHQGKTYVIPVNGYQPREVYRAKVVYEDGTSAQSALFDSNGDNMVFMSDLPFEAKGGYGHGYRADASYDNTVLEILDQTYTKGFGVFTTGWVKVMDLQRFNRFVTDFGYHKGFSGDAIASLLLDGVEVQNSGVFRNGIKLSFDQELNAVGQLEVNFNANGSNWNEIIDMGAARFYEVPKNIREQNISWQTEQEVRTNEPVVFDLTATSSSLNPVYYRIIQGEEYAEITDNGTKLSVIKVPASAEVIVEAFQPGDLEYAPATPQRCSFRLTRAITVQADESCELEGGMDIEELVVHGNALQSGEVRVKDGIVNIRKMIYKYKMIPGRSHMLTFPVAADLDKISDFKAQGYVFNGNTEDGWKLQEYDGQDRALNGQRIQNWKDKTTSVVDPFVGYILVAPQRSAGDSVEVSFVFENVSLDFTNHINSMSLTLDFTGRMPGKDFRAYIQPVNVKGNVLAVSLDYQPPVEAQPLNYREEAEKARVIPFDGGKQFRISLPVTDISSNVFVLNKKGTKVLKAFEYYAPAAIDVSDLKKGRYMVVLKFGDEVSLKELLVE
ncbi:MAG: NPCBM/NEW2 domain-containing protein [Bacteroidales bacterium]